MAITDQDVDWLVETRRHLHRNPEISFHEEKTSAFVEKQLQQLGVPILKTRVGGHYGIVAQLEMPNAQRTIALRADMDALPILEQWPSDFQSCNKGVAHMCGHDSHTTMLLGAIRLLCERKDELKKNVRFFFQHAEEKVPGGAIDFIREGWLDGVDEVYGIHVDPMTTVGEVGSRPGRFLAGAAEFNVRIKGLGGHAALPHRSNDPLLAATQAINSMQSIIPRQLNPLEEAVISITYIHGGHANNVIPAEVKFGGTIRTFSNEIGNEIRKKIRQHLGGICSIWGCEFEADIEDGYPPLINHEAGVQKLQNVLSDRLPQLTYRESEPFMAGEDFARYLQKVPGCFFFVGCSAADDSQRFQLHDPNFHLDEGVLPIGAQILAEVALDSRSLKHP